MMIRPSRFSTCSLALAGLALLGSHAAARSTSATAALAQQASAALGLTQSLVADVQVLPLADQRRLVGLDVLGATVQLELAPHSVRAEGFQARAQQADGSWVVLPPEPVRTYRGTLVGDAGSVVAASLLDDGLHALVRLSSGEEYWIEPLAPHVLQATASQHVLYGTEDVVSGGGTCAADQLPPLGGSGVLNAPSATRAGRLNMASVTAELACDADYEYFQRWGSGTQSRIESVINTMNAQYVRDVGISHTITTILIRTSSNDPYSRKGASQLLGQLRSEWNSNQSGVQRDVVQLFTGKNLSGGTIGIAYVGSVCNLNVAYSLVESDFASNFACVTDLSAHELGHTWGAGHCSCSSFTMNASITCANVFSGVSVNAITSYRDAQTCFGGQATTGTVSGTVTSSAGGAAIVGATVQVDSGQSATTDGNGDYTITDVPTGSRTVTASAVGFTSENAGTTVNENQTSTVDFALDPAPVGSQAIVDCITYSSTGGKNGDRNLFIDVTVVDDGGNPVDGASVSIAVDLDGAAWGSGTATTDAAGQVTFQAKNSPNGCFETDVTGVSAAGLTFDGTEPLNGFTKGSDTSPDPDCRSGSDACGAG